MLYRLQPGQELMWSNTDAALMNLVRNETDLDRLTWRPVETEHRHTEVVGVALRYGVKTATGIAFPAGHLHTVERPRKLLQDYENLRRASADPAIQTADERREQVTPGWIEAGKKNDHDVWASVQAAVLDAEGQTAAIMSAPVREDLAAWWQERGGLLP
jgi:hypothetical protein